MGGIMPGYSVVKTFDGTYDGRSSLYAGTYEQCRQWIGKARKLSGEFAYDIICNQSGRFVSYVLRK